MTEPLGVVVVGLGLAGSLMVEVLREHPDARVVGAVDPDPRLRAGFVDMEALPAFAELAEALELAAVEVVYLASPHEFHADQAIAAAAAGRHVVVEKPMALDVAECDAMIAAAEAAGTVLVVGHTHGFDPAVTRLAELVRDGAYGEVGHLALWNYTNFLYRPRRPADLDPERSAGVVLNQVAHQVDIARTVLARDVRTVRAMTTRLDPARPVDGSCTALVEFAGGVPVSLVYSGYDHFDADELQDWSTESGRAGSPRHGAARQRLAALERSEDEERSRALGYGAAVTRPERQPRFGEVIVSCAQADLRVTADGLVAYGDEGPVREDVGSTAPWAGHLAVFDEVVAAVRAGEPAIHDGRFGRETVRVCRALLQSARSGRTESLDPEELIA